MSAQDKESTPRIRWRSLTTATVQKNGCQLGCQDLCLVRSADVAPRPIGLVLQASTKTLVRLAIVLRRTSDAEPDTQNLALSQQVAVLRRQVARSETAQTEDLVASASSVIAAKAWTNSGRALNDAVRRSLIPLSRANSCASTSRS